MNLDTKPIIAGITMAQGTDEAAASMSTSHVSSGTELDALGVIFTHGGEFGQRLKYAKYPVTTPTAVTAFTAEEQASKLGYLEFELEFESADGSTGKKEIFSINPYPNNSALIEATKAEILAKPATAWFVGQKVINVNHKFDPRKGGN